MVCLLKNRQTSHALQKLLEAFSSQGLSIHGKITTNINWYPAVLADGKYITKYARTNRGEDVADTISFWVAVRCIENFSEKKKNKTNYDCLIPVSGGKDSYYQAHIIAKKYKLKPLLVTYDGNNFLPEGIKNRDNMKLHFDADHIVWSASVKILKKVNKENDNKIKLILVGSASLILLQAMIHIGVNIRLFPTTGMTLPFLSYGGSSIISISVLIL